MRCRRGTCRMLPSSFWLVGVRSSASVLREPYVEVRKLTWPCCYIISWGMRLELALAAMADRGRQHRATRLLADVSSLALLQSSDQQNPIYQRPDLMQRRYIPFAQLLVRRVHAASMTCNRIISASGRTLRSVPCPAAVCHGSAWATGPASMPLLRAACMRAGVREKETPDGERANDSERASRCLQMSSHDSETSRASDSLSPRGRDTALRRR